MVKLNYTVLLYAIAILTFYETIFSAINQNTAIALPPKKVLHQDHVKLLLPRRYLMPL